MVATPATQGAPSAGPRVGPAVAGTTLGSAAGRPATDALAGVDTSYPVTQLAVTIAVAATALPYLSRSFHRLVSFLVGVAAIAAVVDGSALPVNTASSLLLGWGVAAGLHLAVGSPLGLPSPAVFIQRLFTAYLPPIWGWVTLAWMRRREYV
jgi:hypothetical protein